MKNLFNKVISKYILFGTPSSVKLFENESLMEFIGVFSLFKSSMLLFIMVKLDTAN